MFKYEQTMLCDTSSSFMSLYGILSMQIDMFGVWISIQIYYWKNHLNIYHILLVDGQMKWKQLLNICLCILTYVHKGTWFDSVPRNKNNSFITLYLRNFHNISLSFKNEIQLLTPLSCVSYHLLSWTVNKREFYSRRLIKFKDKTALTATVIRLLIWGNGINAWKVSLNPPSKFCS